MKLLGQGLKCVRGGREIFAGLELDVAAGQALAVTGANGAGKSSLLRMIAGLLPLAGGTIRLEGGADELTLAEQAHYLGHRDALKPSLTVRENLDFWQRFLGEGTADIAGALEAVGIGHAMHLPAAVLSAGQRRRLSIARLIAVARPVWLLDEPTSALDVAGQAMVAALMTEHLRGGGLILAATHGPLGISATELRIGGVR
ncbi:MAG: heme ABC exporter ATP-binding protein CcmA [Alphaproteobacteria bacterium]|nr:heme ABC exporter ATP-binding protein CcmA [Alphaproteobacteria bacterium]